MFFFLSFELLPPWRGLADYVARREGAWKGAQNDLVTTDAANCCGGIRYFDVIQHTQHTL